MDPTAKFVYIVNYADNNVSVYSIGSTGSLTTLSTVATGNGPTSVGVDPTGRYLYVVNSLDNTVSAYTVGLTGTLTRLRARPSLPGSVRKQSPLIAQVSLSTW